MSEQVRYERQMAIQQIGKEGQAKLGAARVLVVGAGGLGSPTLTYLARAGVGYLKVIDLDVVSESNLNRQFYYHNDDIGKSKAILASERLRKQNPEIQVCGVETRITKENVEKLLEDIDVVVDCVDNIETRLIMNQACIQKDIPLVEAGIADFYGFVTVVHRESACLECMGFQEDVTQKATPTLGATAGVIGSMQALECIKIILGMDGVAYGKMIQYDGIECTMETIPIGIAEHCRIHQAIKCNIHSYKVVDIVRQTEKGKPEEHLQSAELIASYGLDGDRYAGTGDQQITLIGSRGQKWMEEQDTKGICFKRCKANFVIEGSIRTFKQGEQIQLGDAVLEITIDQKGCHPEDCPRDQHGEHCLLYQELRYAKVIKSGNVRIG